MVNVSRLVNRLEPPREPTEEELREKSIFESIQKLHKVTDHSSASWDKLLDRGLEHKIVADKKGRGIEIRFDDKWIYRRINNKLKRYMKDFEYESKIFIEQVIPEIRDDDLLNRYGVRELEEDVNGISKLFYEYETKSNRYKISWDKNEFIVKIYEIKGN